MRDMLERGTSLAIRQRGQIAHTARGPPSQADAHDAARGG